MGFPVITLQYGSSSAARVRLVCGLAVGDGGAKSEGVSNMKILRQSQSSIRKSVLNHRAFSLSAHQQQIVLHPILSSSPKPYAVTLDDRFMPEGIFTPSMTTRIALLAMAMLVLAVAQFSWKASSFELSHDQENRESHNRKVSFKWWSYVCKFIGQGWINLQQLFGEASESNEMETQAKTDHHSVSNKKHSKGNTAWKICTLERKEILNGRFIFCKFKTSDANLLEFGQKVRKNLLFEKFMV